MPQPVVPAYHPAYRPDIYSTPTPTPTATVQHVYSTATAAPAATVQHNAGLVLQQGADAARPACIEPMEYQASTSLDLPSPSDLRERTLRSPVSVHLGKFIYTEFENREKAPHVVYDKVNNKYTYKNLAPLTAIEDLEDVPVGVDFTPVPPQCFDASHAPDGGLNLNMKQADNITDFDIQNVPQILPDVIFADSVVEYQ